MSTSCLETYLVLWNSERMRVRSGDILLERRVHITGVNHLVLLQVIVNALKYGILRASAICMPPIALGLSTRTSVP